MAHDRSDAHELTEVPPTAYRHGDRLTRARVWLPAVAVLGIVAFGAIALGTRGEVHYTPGALAAVHATWENQCSECHVGAQPLGGQNWLAAVSDWSHAAADEQCSQCHAGPAHHASAEAGPGCASCHREHQGARASLTRVADALCTNCHGDLENHYRDNVASEEKTVANVVAAFNLRQHPPFREIKDTGTVAFNHKLHLSLGLSKVPDPAVPFTLARLPETFRKQFEPFAKDGGIIQLDCAACHQADARDGKVAPGALAGLPQDAVMPARTSGAYMQPILYERHCQACHPLAIDHAYTVRHRVQPSEVEEIARGYYTERFLKNKLGVDADVLKYPLPGKDPRRPDARQTALALIEKHVAADKAILLGPSTCQKCHPSLAQNSRTVAQADIPQVWYQRAKFDHAAHTTVGCRECHGSATESQTNADVLLPRIETCARCHAPPGVGEGVIRSGARFDCVECHRYHNGDQPLQGQGAAARQAQRDR